MTSSHPQDTCTPRPEHRFTFGLRTVGSVGRDRIVRDFRAALEETGHR